MDFCSMNKFNAIVNTLSGNFFPLTERNTDLGFVRTSYLIFTWLVKLSYLSTTTIGLLSYTSTMEIIRKGGTNAIVSLETMILTIYLKSQRERVCNLIHKMNNILIDSTDLKVCLRDAVDPPKKRLKIYLVAAISSVIIWAGMPLVKLLENDRFTYNDYTVTAYLPGAPFTVSVFLCGVAIQIMGNVFISMKKTGIDVYISYFITLLTAEYRYVHEQLVSALDSENSQKDETLVADDLQKCVRHHCTVMEIGSTLKELLSLNVGLTYLNCILRFCFLAFAVFGVPGAYFEKFLCLMYTTGSLIQVYMLCSCVQDLLEASTSITDAAFHKNWHGRGSAVKNIFRTILLSNQMECRLTAFRIVDLTVPTFASIINQAYTGCLLLLRFN